LPDRLTESRLLRDEAKLEQLARLTASHVPEKGWSKRVACTGRGHLFFAPDDQHHAPYSEARKLCNRCPVRWDCLAENIDELEGCFAGTTPSERQRLRVTMSELGLARAHESVQQRWMAS
jgi:hypothetical protein